MTASLNAVLDGIAALFAVNHTSKPVPGTFDLSATNAVRRGVFNSPWHVGAPCVALEVAAVETTRRSDRMGAVPLTQTSRDARIVARAWAPVSAPADPSTRQAAALNLANDLMRALEADYSVGGRVLECDSAIDFLGGDVITADGAEYATIALRLSVVYRTTLGAL